MATARVFRSGNSQAVRLPKEYRLKGPEIFRRGEEIVLREKTEGLVRAFRPSRRACFRCWSSRLAPANSMDRSAPRRQPGEI
jgi:virulence-associated protein VagC